MWLLKGIRFTSGPFCVGESMKEVDPFYRSKRWENKRNKILRRDGYRCQYYSRYGKNRQANTVHHIFPREQYPEYEWCDWNLISLSNEAHNKMHERATHDLTEIGEELLRRTARQKSIRLD